MTKKEQLEIERQRRETALKNTFFNRYLLLRYTIALFFFWQYLLAFESIYSSFFCYCSPYYVNCISDFGYC